MAIIASFFGEEIKLESERARRLFTTGGWNTVIRASGQVAGVRFLENYVPLRWSKAYAVGQLLYTRGGARPFYLTGDWLEAAEGGSNAQSVATKGDVRVRVIVPLPHGVQPETAAGFKKITLRERTYVKRQFHDALIRFIDSTPVKVAARINGRARAQVDKALGTASRQRAKSIILSSKLQSRTAAFAARNVA